MTICRKAFRNRSVGEKMEENVDNLEEMVGTLEEMLEVLEEM